MVEQDAPENIAAQEAEVVGQRILERIRAATNDEHAYFNGDEGEDDFRTLYLTSRDTAIPPNLVSDDLRNDIHVDIRELFFQVYDGIRAELLDAFGRDIPVWLAVDASVEDHSTAILCTDETVLAIHGSKAWNFWWGSESEMAADLGRWYDTAARRLIGEITRPPTQQPNDGTPRI